MAKMIFFFALWLSFAFNGIPAQSTTKVVVSGISKTVTEQIFFQIYKGPTSKDYIRVKFEDGLAFPNYNFFDKNAQTFFHFPGWTERPPTEESVAVLADAFLSQKKDNFVVLDYSPFVRNGTIFQYVDAVMNATFLGDIFGQYFKQYVGTIQSPEQIRLLSHSLGSQIMSKTAKRYAPSKFKWITALDPAGPIFTMPFVEHLTKDDGEFLDVIHTDAGGHGDGRTLGHADFFPNLGHAIQPYCTKQAFNDFCSHSMSWKYYAESVKNPNAFPAKKCTRTPFCDINLVLCSCEKTNAFIYMGYGVDKKASGDYYLKTSDTSPFSLGVAGTNF